MLRKGWSIGALVILVSFVCLLPTRAGYPEDQPRLLNPFAGDPEAVKEGRRLFMSNGCSGCHGLGGGGGMGKSILDDVWEFGSDDETLYKLIKGQIPNQTMPRTSAGLPDEQVWKLLAYVRSLYKGDPGLINWGLTRPSTTAGASPSPTQRQCPAIGGKAEVEGTITAKAASSITVIQEGEVKGNYLCQVSGATQIRKGNTTLTLSQLQIGWRVHVSGTGLGLSGGMCQVKADQTKVQ